MRRDPALSLRGALQVLGADEHPVLSKLDQLLGGALLGAAALVNPALLGLIDPKAEARQLIQSLLDAVDQRTLGTGGLRRHQRVTAAHSIIVVAAFFDALREAVGAKMYARLALTKEEKLARATGTEPEPNATLLARLLGADVPMPYVARGFAENLPVVRGFLAFMAEATLQFLGGLRAWEPFAGKFARPAEVEALVSDALARYAESYEALGVRVPEFRMWVELGEHHATRAAVRAAVTDLLGAVRATDEALAALDAALSAHGPGGTGRP
jgi:hypothetical protein